MKKQLNIEIGQRVRLSRKKRKLTRDQLAEAIGISTLFLGYIECGQKGMSMETLLALSSLLHVSCDYLLTGQEAASIPSEAEDSHRTLYQLVSRVSPEDVPLMEKQIQLSLELLNRTVAVKKERNSGISAEASSNHEIILAARNGRGQKLLLNPEEITRLNELSEGIDSF